MLFSIEQSILAEANLYQIRQSFPPYGSYVHVVLDIHDSLLHCRCVGGIYCLLVSTVPLYTFGVSLHNRGERCFRASTKLFAMFLQSASLLFSYLSGICCEGAITLSS